MTFRKLAQVSTLAVSLAAAVGSSAHADGWAAVAGPHGGAAAVNYQGGPVFRGGRGAWRHGGSAEAGAAAVGLVAGAMVGAAASSRPDYVAPAPVVYAPPPVVYAPRPVVYAPDGYYYYIR